MVAKTVAIRWAELMSHVKMVFADSSMLRTEVWLGNNSHFISNSHLHLVSSEACKFNLIQPLVAAASFSCIDRVAPE